VPLPLLNVRMNYLVNFKTLQFLTDILIPEMAECLWNFPCPSLPDPEAELKAQLDKSSLARTVKPGSRIAITAGSRGISRIDTILARICEEVKKLHAHPVVVSAMGSHGGATEEGQREILKGYGITPERVGAPVLCSVNTVEVGKTADGMPVFVDDEAFQSDGIIVVNWVKSHTSFQGATESGLLKMLAVGLGKHKGAQHIHQLGTRGLKTGIPQAAQVILNRVAVLLGIGIIKMHRVILLPLRRLSPPR
jgi:nickel-dependent lactate racemase